jgi:hypothetical protein
MLNVQRSPTYQALPIWTGFRGNLEDIRMLSQDGASEDAPGHALLLLSHEVPQSRTGSLVSRSELGSASRTIAFTSSSQLRTRQPYSRCLSLLTAHAHPNCAQEGKGSGRSGARSEEPPVNRAGLTLLTSAPLVEVGHLMRIPAFGDLNGPFLVQKRHEGPERYRNRVIRRRYAVSEGSRIGMYKSASIFSTSWTHAVIRVL